MLIEANMREDRRRRAERMLDVRAAMADEKSFAKILRTLDPD